MIKPLDSLGAPFWTPDSKARLGVGPAYPLYTIPPFTLHTLKKGKKNNVLSYIWLGLNEDHGWNITGYR